MESGNAHLKIYNGGSSKDDEISSLTGNQNFASVSSTKNQLFISLIIDGHGIGKGFSASLEFCKLCY